MGSPAKGRIGVPLLLVVSSLLFSCSFAIRHQDADTGGAVLTDQSGLAALAKETAGDYAPGPNAQVFNDESGGTSVVLSNQNSVHEQTDDSWKAPVVQEAQKKTREENKRKQALEEKRKQQYEEANKQDQEEERQKDLKEQNLANKKPPKPAATTDNGDQPAEAAASQSSLPQNTAQAPPPLSGICTFAKDASCGSNLQNRGLSGIIMRKDQYSNNPFSAGGDFNTGWQWTHPYLCCATTDDAPLSDKFVFAKTCPSSTRTVAYTGVLMLTKDYEQNNVFTAGGDFNSGWRWTHPVMCAVSDATALLQQTGWCLIAAQCPPGGKWTDRGFGGVIVVNKQYDMQPFHSGGAFNADWKWAHPKLCCRLST